MTIADHELEFQLRALGRRGDEVAPAPFDLAQRVRDRHRARRRRELGLGGAALTALLVFAGVPVVASTVTAGWDRSDAAAPSHAGPDTLMDLPTRGSLAGDDDWVTAVRALSWAPADAAEFPDLDWPDPPVEDRRVAWAGEVAGGRVALVLARTDQQTLLHAWYIGPQDAAPEDMALVTAPSEADPVEPLNLIATPDDPSGQETLVVVGLPGDEVEARTGRTVTATAEVVEQWTTVPMEQGAGALFLHRPVPAWRSEVKLSLIRDGQTRRVQASAYMREEDHDAALAPVDVADPRGLRGRVDADELRMSARILETYYALPIEELHPTLLAAGPVGAGSRNVSFLVGVTFPSGAMAAIQTDYHDRDSASYASSMRITLAPAGTPLLEQVVAVASSDSITVSGPEAGRVAEIYLSGGRLHTTVPLVDGAGVGPLAPPAADRVRILDEHGAVVAEAPLSEAK